jgi:phosphatidate cytidylyltransferase
MVGSQLSSTARRFIGVLVLVPIITAVWVDVKTAGIVVTLLAVGMAYEFSKILKMPVIMATVLTLLISLQAFPVWVFDASMIWHSGLAAVSSCIAMMYRGALAGLFAIVLSLCLYFSTLLLKQTDGHWLLLVLTAVVAACDSAAYFVGRSVGGVKLAPLISPNKTVSGSVGGIVAAIAVMVGLSSIQAFAPITGLGPVTGLGSVVALFVGCGVAVLAQIGDLLESALKRYFNVKDSGSLLPGHGGLLDRFDGYLFTVPGFYLFLFAN